MPPAALPLSSPSIPPAGLTAAGQRMHSRPGHALDVLARVAAAIVVATAVVAVPTVEAADDAWVAAAEATGSGPLETAIVAEKLLIEAGPGQHEWRRWVPARRLSAGDEVHYTVRVHNPGKTPVTDVVVTKRLPFGVRYQVGSATGPACDIQFSADGGHSFAAPEQASRAATGKTRKGQRKPVTADYSHVRWVLTKPLVPGATALLRFRATFS